MRIAGLGAAYFAIVFTIGFVLGVTRVLWLAPALGERYAELFEMPLMVAASFLTARFLIGLVSAGPSRRGALMMGAIALTLLLAAELTFVLGLRGLSLYEYLDTRDTVAGIAYCVSLALFMLMPWLVVRGRRG